MFDQFIIRQDTVVTINGTSNIAGGAEHDIVNIDTVTTLANPNGQDITLVLPAITDEPQKAYIRTLDELENKSVFQPPVPTEFLDADMPEEDRITLEQAIAANMEQWNRIKELAGNVQVTKISLKAGDQELKFFLHKTLKLDEQGIYELSFIAPFSNLKPQNGFQMSLIIILPPQAQPVGAPEISNPTGGPLPQLVNEGNRVGRYVYEFVMTQDPIFKIRYRY